MPTNNNRNVYIETYGCQMNFSDSEIISSIMVDSGYNMTETADNADVIFLNTCSVRENAESKIYKRLTHLRQYQKKNNKLVVGILGCMAKRLQKDLIEHKDIVSLIVGPDEYRSIPSLVDNAFQGEEGIAVKLSRVETYDDIAPLRTSGVSAWLSIMRGCDNFCAFCVVPYTRGRERSRPAKSVLDEIKRLIDIGIKEVTLLGQNVNSYKDPTNDTDFPKLLSYCAREAPDMRIRYVTSHPKDMSDRLIETMAEYDNICNYIHLPVQSGSNTVLERMKRSYTVEHYLGRIERVRELIPECSFSTDIIAGYPGETEEDHKATLALMRHVRYDGAYMFKYSPRENTRAFKLEDDVPEEEKQRRLNEIITQQNGISKELNELETGKTYEVLVEGPSKKSDEEWQGRTDTNKVVIFGNHPQKYRVGDLVNVKIERSTSATLFGKALSKQEPKVKNQDKLLNVISD